jgi:quercetin dioxygenase-like cupin family protein
MLGGATAVPFYNISDIEPFELLPGLRIRAPFGKNLMLSYLEFDRDAVVPFHTHPHEQGGIVLQGKVELTIGDDARIVGPGSLYIVPPNTPHRAASVDGPAVVLDVFSPVREDYAEKFNKYIHPASK